MTDSLIDAIKADDTIDVPHPYDPLRYVAMVKTYAETAKLFSDPTIRLTNDLTAYRTRANSNEEVDQ